MTLRLPLSDNKHDTLISAYASTMTNPDEVKGKFFDDLNSIISATPHTDKLIILGDLNALDAFRASHLGRTDRLRGCS